MARHSVLPGIASLWTPESPEARRLADALRQRRLSILCGEHDDERAGLIVTGVLPMLRRRATDAAMLAPRATSAVILPFERRSATRARLAELVVFCDEWNDASPERMHRAIDDALQLAGVAPEHHAPALAERVRALVDRHGMRVLLILDCFDPVLDAGNPAPARPALLDELASLLSQSLPANVLISMRSEASLLLERLTERGVTLEAEQVTLSSHSVASATSPAPAATNEPGSTPPHEQDSHDTPDDIYADIITFVERSRERGGAPTEAAGNDLATQGLAPAPRRDELTPRRPSAQVIALSNALMTSMTPRAQPAHVPIPAATKRLPAPSLDGAGRVPWPWPWALAAIAVLVSIAMFFGLRDVSPPAGPLGDDVASLPDTTTATVPARPATPTAASKLPALAIAVESEDKTLPVPVAELLHQVAANTGVKANPVETLSPASSPTDVSIVRYDALQATALRGDSMPIRVIAPLYTEELYVVARADSPLRYFHQLQGRRINVGPVNGARALTALALYERMFGKPLPAARRNTLTAADALQRLAARHPGFDAVVLVQPQPSGLWDALAPEARRALRLLSLDPQHPASRRALQAYLPATLHERGSPPLAAPSSVPTLAAMSFLAANGTPNAAHHAAIVAFTRSLCLALPVLKREGHPKWREVRAGQQLETPWMPESAAATAWSHCADTDPPALLSSPPQGAR